MREVHRKKRIISFDLDMTLLDHQTWKIPDSAMEALRLLREENLIVVASGRNMDHALSAEYRDIIQPDAIIHMNGTRVVADGRVLYEHLMDKGRLEALLTYAEARGVSVGISTDEGDFYMNPGIVEEMDRLRWGETQRNFQDPWKMMDMPIRTLAYIGGPEGIPDLEKQFPEFKFPMFSGRRGADIVEQEASKAEGQTRLCQYYEIEPSQTVAFGDSMNDYEIIQEAGIGIAMGNSIEELKQVADYVTDRVDQDGVWKACRHFGWV